MVWLCGLVAFLVSVDWLAGHAHYFAAGGLLLGIVLVAVANASRRREKPTIARALSSPREYYYTWAAVAMLAGTAVLIVLWLAGVISLFLVEIVVALLFIAFWTVQTVELETGHADHHDETQNAQKPPGTLPHGSSCPTDAADTSTALVIHAERMPGPEDRNTADSRAIVPHAGHRQQNDQAAERRT